MNSNIQNDSNLLPPLTESLLENIFQSIVQIEKGEKKVTGFFFKIQLNNKERKFLCIPDKIISKEDLDSTIDIYYFKKHNKNNIKLKLDESNRFIHFDSFEKIIFIEILENDPIHENQYLFEEKDYNKNQKAYLPGYILNNLGESERAIYIGEVNYGTFSHSNNIENIENGFIGSPIISTENKGVLGIFSLKNNAKKIDLVNFHKESLFNLGKALNRRNIFSHIPKYIFLSLEEYKNKSFFEYHKRISLYNNYLMKSSSSLTGETISQMKISNIDEKIFEMNKRFYSLKNYEDMIYSITGYINAIIMDKGIKISLNVFKINFITISNNMKLYFKTIFSEIELDFFKHNINKIIFTPQSILADDYDFKNKLELKYKYNFNSIVIINYNEMDNCMSKYPKEEYKYIFPFFMFFKINNFEKKEEKFIITLSPIHNLKDVILKLENANNIKYDESNNEIIVS